MSDEAIRTIRGNWPDGIGQAIGHEKLGAVFADAEKWTERDENAEGWTVAWRWFVRHPEYPECTMMVEAEMTPRGSAGPGTSRMTVRRVISDDGRTPAKALNQIARYSVFVVERLRDSGHYTYSPEKRRAIAEHYRKDRHLITNKDAWAFSHYGITGRTVREYEKEFPET